MDKKFDDVVVFDVLGPICGYEDNGRRVPVDDVADWIVAKVKELAGREPKDLAEEVAWEEQAERDGLIKVVENPGALDLIHHVWYYSTPVIATSYTKKGAEFIIEELVRQHNDRSEGYKLSLEGLFSSSNIFSFTDKGLSKGDMKHWKRVIKPYSRVLCVFEDSLKRLKTAIEAYDCPGFHVTEKNDRGIMLKHGKIPERGVVYRGNMDRLYGYVSRLLPLDH